MLESAICSVKIHENVIFNVKKHESVIFSVKGVLMKEAEALLN